MFVAHCDDCDDEYCGGPFETYHRCNEHCEDPHLTSEHETSLALLEALLDMGMSEHELSFIAASSDVSRLFRKYLIDNLS